MPFDDDQVYDQPIEEFIEEVESGNNELELFQGKTQLTDLGNAERFVQECRTHIRFVFLLNKWLIWDSKRWSFDNTNQIYQLAKDTIRKMYLEATLEEDETAKKKLITHLLKTESRRKIVDMIELAKSEYGVPILPENLDSNPYLLQVNNGTVDLKTGKLMKSNPDDFISKHAMVDFDIDAEYPKWLEFLNTIMNGDDDLVRFLQKAVGYSMTGDTSEQVWFLLYGSGANGKSTLLATIRSILNDYAVNTPAETFMAKYGDSASNDIARLRGSRIVTSFESSEGRKLNESLIKQLTGSDTISARFLYSEFFDFRPTFKVWLSTNYKPVITGTDYATWRRVRLIPFLVKIPEDKWIKDFYQVLYDEEGPGILNWMIDGCLLWQLEGVGNPEEVKTATECYRDEMDDLNNFIENFCNINKSEKLESMENDKISKYDLENAGIYRAKVSFFFEKWREVTGNRLSQKAFNRKMKEKGFRDFRFRDGYYWLGIGIID